MTVSDRKLDQLRLGELDPEDEREVLAALEEAGELHRLDALIGAGARRRESLDLPEVDAELTTDGDEDATVVPPPAPEERLERLPLGQLSRGRYQPRRDIQPGSACTASRASSQALSPPPTTMTSMSR